MHTVLLAHIFCVYIDFIFASSSLTLLSFIICLFSIFFFIIIKIIIVIKNFNLSIFDTLADITQNIGLDSEPCDEFLYFNQYYATNNSNSASDYSSISPIKINITTELGSINRNFATNNSNNYLDYSSTTQMKTKTTTELGSTSELFTETTAVDLCLKVLKESCAPEAFCLGSGTDVQCACHKNGYLFGNTGDGTFGCYPDHVNQPLLGEGFIPGFAKRYLKTQLKRTTKELLEIHLEPAFRLMPAYVINSLEILRFRYPLYLLTFHFLGAHGPIIIISKDLLISDKISYFRDPRPSNYYQ